MIWKRYSKIMTPTGTPSNQSAIARIIFSLAHSIVVMAIQLASLDRMTAIFLPSKCRSVCHGKVRDARDSLWQHAEEDVSRVLETRLDERLLSIG